MAALLLPHLYRNGNLAYLAIVLEITSFLEYMLRQCMQIGRYKPDLESVNDLYGSPYDYTETDEEEVQTPKRKCAIECPPAPKKGLKRQRSDSMVTQYDSDEDEEQKLLEVHEMNHPKRIKV